MALLLQIVHPLKFGTELPAVQAVSDGSGGGSVDGVGGGGGRSRICAMTSAQLHKREASRRATAVDSNYHIGQEGILFATINQCT